MLLDVVSHHVSGVARKRPAMAHVARNTQNQVGDHSMFRESLCGIALIGGVVVGACSGTGTASPLDGDVVENSATVVLSITPARSTANVDPSSPISVVFNHPMMTGMEFLVMVHGGSVLGPQVLGTSSWSSNHAVLTFVPAQLLKSKTTYVPHLSPSLEDASGRGIDFARCAQQVSGQPVPVGWPMGAMMGSGSVMMGPGWQPGAGTWAKG